MAVTALKLRLNPLETIGLSRHLLERFKPEHGVGPEQLATFISKMVVHGSAPFHPDINQNPNAEQVFKDINDAGSQVDTPEKLAIATQQYLARPADQVAQVREQYNAKLAQIQSRLSDRENILLQLLISNAKGNELFAAPNLRQRRFCVNEPAIDLLYRGRAINFGAVYFPSSGNLCEYQVDNSGNLRKYKLERSDHVLVADLIDKYKPKPEEIILNTEQPSQVERRGQKREVSIHPLYARSSKAEEINDLRIIGTLYFGDVGEHDKNINLALNKVFGLSYDPVFEEAPKVQLIEGRTVSQDELVTPIAHDLINGIPLAKFKKLLRYISQGVQEDHSILIAYRESPEPSIVLLGRIPELHEKTPNLYRKS